MCLLFHTDKYLCKKEHMEKDTLINRIKKLIDREGVSTRMFEKKINATQGVISKAIKNNGDIKGKLLISIVENYTHISSSWLLTGKGEMLLSGVEKPISGITECKECEKFKEKIDLLEQVIEAKNETIKALQNKDSNGSSKRQYSA